MAKVAKLEKPFANRIVGHGEEDPEQLLANPFNARLHPDHQQQALAGAIDEVGYIRSVTVNRLSGHVVDGHLRVTLALRSGVKALPVEYVELTDDEEKLALLTLDPIASMAAADKDKLEELLHSVQSDDERVSQMLTELAAREGLAYGDEPKDVEPQFDRAAELLEKWGVEYGSLWKIADHRLLCGDSTVRADVERVMGGEKAILLIADPPYGVNYVGKTRDALTIENDGRDHLFGLLHAALIVVQQALYDGAAFYIAAPAGPQSYEFSNAIVKAGLNWRQTLVWIKNAMVLGHSDYHYKHEIIFYGSKGKKSKFYGNRKNVSVLFDDGDQPFREIGMGLIQAQIGNEVYLIRGENIEIDAIWPDTINIVRPSASQLHPTMKPIELMELFVKNSSARHDLVCDPFGGSGTTMMACQNLGRQCRMVEISEQYCAVILERIETAFGLIGERIM